jgi:hypothetical protein
MKRAGLWAIGIVALASVGPLVEQGYAGESEGGCTLATLRGLYMFAQSGVFHYPDRSGQCAFRNRTEGGALAKPASKRGRGACGRPPLVTRGRSARSRGWRSAPSSRERNRTKRCW